MWKLNRCYKYVKWVFGGLIKLDVDEILLDEEIVF